MRKILLQILVFWFLFILVFSINRLFMQENFIPNELMQSHFSDIAKMYILGAYHDIRLLSAAFLPLLLCMLLLPLKNLLCKFSPRLNAIFANEGGAL